MVINVSKKLMQTLGGALAAAMISFAVTPVAVAASFTDVNNDTPHHDDIIWLADNGITTGYEDGTFGGSRTVVRQDMAAFLYRLAGSPSYAPSQTDMSTFVDVNTSTPHYKEILWLASTGISTGWDTPAGKEFRGAQPVVRQDMAAFLHRYAAKFPDHVKAEINRNVSFADVDSHTGHSEDVIWLARTGVSQGYSDGSFQGLRPVVRQDMAAFLNRITTGNVPAPIDTSRRFASVAGSYWWPSAGVSQSLLVLNADGTFTGKYQEVKNQMDNIQSVPPEKINTTTFSGRFSSIQKTDYGYDIECDAESLSFEQGTSSQVTQSSGMIPCGTFKYYVPGITTVKEIRNQTGAWAVGGLNPNSTAGNILASADGSGAFFIKQM
ncbi:S-layer homology domain-containing protein [Bifidobacterium callitrichidarum]|uniref:SLH domain-containing protein n=1 Tax=Bifidobacterium callitrichidarum TaxID=2052941 RepID=A0A2U2NAE6_9BIFI|nr:S-layer homology domain-containing protein [Bifidobacterium callitrichidarum]PWG66121.1 hypothetical protein DF196_04740 [Bifidobacterium callitrichidarum]